MTLNTIGSRSGAANRIMTMTPQAAMTCIELRLFQSERAGRSPSATGAATISRLDEPAILGTAARSSIAVPAKPTRYARVSARGAGILVDQALAPKESRK